MGYTHYWSFNFKAGKASDLETRYQQAILECQKLIYKSAQEAREQFGTSGLAGYTAHVKPGYYTGLLLNGSTGQDAEPFIMREHLKQNEAKDFCKTNRQPYDILVQACLLILQYRLKDAMTLNSDGDTSEWEDARDLAAKHLRRSVQIPSTIRSAPLAKRRA